MNRERGFVLSPLMLKGLIYVGAALAIMAALGYVVHKIKDAGRAEVRAEWSEANRKERERLERERETRNDITDKQEAKHATEISDLQARYRSALLTASGLRQQPGGDGEAKPLSAAAAILACPDRQADAARRLEQLESGVLTLLERGDRAIVRTETCRAWLAEQLKVKVE